MKKRFIDLATNWKYAWPMWLIVLFYIMLLRNHEHLVIPGVLWTLLWVCSSSLLMSAGRWWGSIVGVLWSLSFYAEYLYKCYLIRYKGQIIYHNFNTLPITLVFMAYFVFMGWRCYKEHEKKERKTQ